MTTHEVLNGPEQVTESIEAEINHQGVKILLYNRDEDAGRPAYCITVGMYQYGLPEVIMFSVPPDVFKVVVDHLGNEVLEGRVPVHQGLLPADYMSLPVYAEEVSGPLVEDYCEIVHDYYQYKGLPGPRIAQWVIADYNGRFPWNPEFDPELRNRQVMLKQGLAPN